jgi:hypothetical protein
MPLLSSESYICWTLELAIMLTNILTIVFLTTSAIAHGDHEHQVPIAGPHKALWYNTLPGDGGTQVCPKGPNGFWNLVSCWTGRFRFLGHFDIRSSPILPMSGI